MKKELKKVGEFWSNKIDTTVNNKKLRWWQSDLIVGHVNSKVNGQNVTGQSQGLTNRLKNKIRDRIPLNKGISVGCGTGEKEMKLVKDGLVKYFDLYDVSEKSIKIGREKARAKKLENNVRFFHDDVFSKDIKYQKYN